jgi:predicted  nucleic acid-binding Zn-ribbon protein
MTTPASLFREIHQLRRFARDLQEQLDRIPRQRKIVQAKLTRQQQALAEQQDAVRKRKSLAAEKESTIKTNQAKQTKCDQQINSASSKKEYDGLILEIARLKEVNAKLEDETLALLTEVDEQTAKLPEFEQALATVREDVNKFEADTEKRKKDLETHLSQALTRLKEVESQIPKDLRPQYDRTIISMGADGFALVKNLTCTACHGEIMRQTELDLRAEKFVVCRSCGRIQYMEAPASPTTEGELYYPGPKDVIQHPRACTEQQGVENS